jgi:metallo-beta-lactamase class B
VKALIAIILLNASIVHSQADKTSRSWNQPREPFQIIGNVYYVGASDITSFLITSSKGHFLLDGGFVETAPMILANIKELGFNPRDVKFLLNSQAHFDHAGGLAELKKQTGAQMVASQEDGAVLRRGGKQDFYFGDKYQFPAVEVDQIVKNGANIQIGDVAMSAILTPGHTKGCTTWRTTAHENGRDYNVVFLCGLTVLPNTDLSHNVAYPNIASDFMKSFQILKNLPCDVFLGAHGSYFHLDEKVAERKKSPNGNPFIISEELKKYAEQKEKNFRSLLNDSR